MSSPLPTALPFGLRDLKLTPYTDDSATVLDTQVVDLPVIRKLSFSEAEDYTDLRGDDELVTSHGSGANVEWEIEAGGISMPAWAVLGGGTVTETGTAPSRTRSYSKSVSDVRPPFMLEGQSISDSGGDLHCVIWRCKVTDKFEGEFGDGEFFLTGCSGKGYASLMSENFGELYVFVQNETATAIFGGLTAPANLAHGTATSTTIPLTWTAVSDADSYHVYYKLHSASTWTAQGGDIATTNYTVTGLTTATSYDVKVCAVRDSVEGPFSELDSTTTA
jgi:hypothetical protein